MAEPKTYDELERLAGSGRLLGAPCCHRGSASSSWAALNAWCELFVEDLSGRCPHLRVSLPPDPKGKGTDSSCLTWTPSSPHFTLRSTTFASPVRRKRSPVPKPPSVQVRSSPSPSSPGGRDSPARGTSTAMPRLTCATLSLPCPAARSSIA